MADNQARRGTATPVVCGHEEATASWLYAEGSEEVATNVKQPGGPHLPARSEVDAVCAPGEDAGEGLLALLDLLPNRIGDRRRSADASPHPFHIREVNFGQFLRGL